MKYEDVELPLLRELEAKVHNMFGYTGWDQDCDDDARKAVLEAQAILRSIQSLKRLLGNNNTGDHV